jgi:hypothetical protein
MFFVIKYEGCTKITVCVYINLRQKYWKHFGTFPQSPHFVQYSSVSMIWAQTYSCGRSLF